MLISKRRLRAPFESLKPEISASLVAPRVAFGAAHQKAAMESDWPRTRGGLSTVRTLASLQLFPPSQGFRWFKKLLPFSALISRNDMALYH